jgi:hypothetical protein
VRRALLALERRGDVISLPGRPRRWALVKGRRYRRSKAEDPAQLELPLFYGSLRSPRGGIVWDDFKQPPRPKGARR